MGTEGLVTGVCKVAAPGLGNAAPVSVRRLEGGVGSGECFFWSPLGEEPLSGESLPGTLHPGVCSVGMESL